MISRILKINVKALVRTNMANPDFILDGCESEIPFVFSDLFYRVSKCENMLHINFTSPSFCHKQCILLIPLPHLKIKCSEKSYLDALLSPTSENTESYGKNSYIFITGLVCKDIELSFVKKQHIILAKVILKVLLSQGNEKSSVQLIRRVVYFFVFSYL